MTRSAQTRKRDGNQLVTLGWGSMKIRKRGWNQLATLGWGLMKIRERDRPQLDPSQDSDGLSPDLRLAEKQESQQMRRESETSARGQGFESAGATGFAMVTFAAYDAKAS